MPLTRPIPPEAMPVVEVLRRETKRPKQLPHFTVGYRHNSLVWTRRRCEVCAMGLRKGSEPMPTNRREFGACTDAAVVSFGEWFDEQDDAEAAVNEIWPVSKEQPE